MNIDIEQLEMHFLSCIESWFTWQKSIVCKDLDVNRDCLYFKHNCAWFKRYSFNIELDGFLNSFIEKYELFNVSRVYWLVVDSDYDYLVYDGTKDLCRSFCHNLNNFISYLRNTELDMVVDSKNFVN